LEGQALLGLAAVEAAAGRSTPATGTAREWYRAVGHVTGAALADRFLDGFAARPRVEPNAPPAG
jgi:hypothetical protein